MKFRMVWLAIVGWIGMGAFSPTAEAQGNVEITPFIGYTLSEGIDFSPQTVNGVEINKLIPRSGFSYGVQGEYVFEGSYGVGFQFSDQLSELEVGSPNATSKEVVTDMNVRNYHATFTYNVGRDGDQIRPYFFIGLGATQYSFDPIMGNAVDGSSRFSSTWGGGVKVYMSDHIGFRGTGRWTPTYINSEADGLWCSPYWPTCWVVGSPNYSHQFEMSGGVVFKF